MSYLYDSLGMLGARTMRGMRHVPKTTITYQNLTTICLWVQKEHGITNPECDKKTNYVFTWRAEAIGVPLVLEKSSTVQDPKYGTSVADAYSLIGSDWWISFVFHREGNDLDLPINGFNRMQGYLDRMAVYIPSEQLNADLVMLKLAGVFDEAL